MTKSERDNMIWKLHKEGYSQKEIGKFYNLSQSAVSLIIINKREGKPERTKETRGRKSEITLSQLEELKETLSKTSAAEIGFSYWNKWSVRALIKEKFGVEYHQNYIWEIMKKIGYTSQVPQKKDYRKDPRKVKKFKEEKGPAIKKKQMKKIG